MEHFFLSDDGELGYTEGDLDDVDWAALERLQSRIDEINAHPVRLHRDLASVGLLVEMYGDDLDVR